MEKNRIRTNDTIFGVFNENSGANGEAVDTVDTTGGTTEPGTGLEGDLRS